MIVVRALLFNTLFWTVSIIMTLGWLPTLALPRKYAVIGMRAWAHLMLTFLHRIVGVNMETRGLHHRVDGPVLYAMKHQSMWDTIVPYVLFQDPVIVMKKELMALPLYGWYAKKAGMVPVDRAAGASALKTMVRAAQQKRDAGHPIIIFPEGTRANPGAEPDYKPGVAALYNQLGVPCIPVAVNSGLVWGRRSFIKKPGTITLEFLEPIEPGLKRKAFMAELENRIESATNRLIGNQAPPSETE